MRVSTKLSFEDQESFKEAVGSLCFNNSQSASDLDLDAIRVRVTASGTFESDSNIQRMGSILPQGQRGVKILEIYTVMNLSVTRNEAYLVWRYY